MEKTMNIENETKRQMKWKEVFATEVSKKIGYNIGVDHIHSDENGWYYYISQKSLLPKHPLLMMHYRGPLFAVIPYMEYKQLENGTVDVTQYIDEAKWNFGYYWGGGSLVGGSFWQPLEDCFGIHDTEKISRYLHILSCKTNRSSSGYMPSASKCMGCKIERCPFSQVDAKKVDASWNNEVKEHDYRKELFEAFSKRAENELDLNVHGLLTYSGENVLLIPNSTERSCVLYIPVQLNNDILYHPGDRDWNKIASEYKFELGVSYKSERMIVDMEQLTVPAPEFCKNFWSEFGIYEEWDLAEARKKHWRNEDDVQRAEKELERAQANLAAARENAWQSKLTLEELKEKATKKANEEFDERQKESDKLFFKKLGKTIIQHIPFVKKFVK